MVYGDVFKSLEYMLISGYGSVSIVIAVLAFTS